MKMQNLQQIKDSLRRVAKSEWKKTTCQLSPASCQMLLEALDSSVKSHPTCSKCGLILFNEATRQIDGYAATDKFCTCSSSVSSKLSPTLRKHLEWAWNYAIAEGYREYTTKEIARDIADGIMRGEDAEDDNLLEDFARNYAYLESGLTHEETDKWTIDEEWHPENQDDCTKLIEALGPIVAKLIEDGEM
jgi:hypothetical protein